jgi:hypothetical protein
MPVVLHAFHRTHLSAHTPEAVFPEPHLFSDIGHPTRMHGLPPVAELTCGLRKNAAREMSTE